MGPAANFGVCFGEAIIIGCPTVVRVKMNEVKMCTLMKPSLY